MPSDAWTDAERQLLQRAVRAVPEDLEKKARWTQIAVLVGGGRGRKECYEHWKALVAAVERLLGDGDLRMAMGRAGRERVMEHYTEARTTQRVADCYRQCLERRPLRVSGL